MYVAALLSLLTSLRFDAKFIMSLNLFDCIRFVPPPSPTPKHPTEQLLIVLAFVECKALPIAWLPGCLTRVSGPQVRVSAADVGMP